MKINYETVKCRSEFNNKVSEHKTTLPFLPTFNFEKKEL